MKKIIFTLAVVFISLSFVNTADAVSGRLDRNGCHNDRKYGTGYHCHRPKAPQVLRRDPEQVMVQHVLETQPTGTITNGVHILRTFYQNDIPCREYTYGPGQYVNCRRSDGYWVLKTYQMRPRAPIQQRYIAPSNSGMTYLECLRIAGRHASAGGIVLGRDPLRICDRFPL